MMQLQDDPNDTLIWKFSMYSVLGNENFNICALLVMQYPGYNFGPVELDP